jgi:hypothetical protein
MFVNDLPEAVKDKLVVILCDDPRENLFKYRVKCPDTQANIWDVAKVKEEIEKIMPNVRVTQQLVMFFSKSIIFIGSELGKKGTYTFELDQVRA